MIPRTELVWQGKPALNWQQQLARAVSDPRELLHILKLDPALVAGSELPARQFPLRVPHAFIARMEPGKLSDPLLRQVLPIDQELIARGGYTADPVSEQVQTIPGLIRKYHGRALLLVNSHCAVNCRYCFRRHFPYAENRLNREQWRQVLAVIQADSSITEIIYSGGDPLVASDRQLRWLTQAIADIPHIQRLRIHTRLPVVIPDRVTGDCLQWLTATRLSTVMVLHINHPNEIDEALVAALGRLKNAGITLLNQAVLLKAVNDDPPTLKKLSERLFLAGVLPYYLHLFDKVAGAAHFDLPLARARELHQQLRHQLPGYLVPKLVREEAGKAAKTPAELLLP